MAQTTLLSSIFNQAVQFQRQVHFNYKSAQTVLTREAAPVPSEREEETV